MLNYTGKLKVKGETIQVSEKFRKRSFVLDDGADSYPQTPEFQLTQDRVELLNDINIGDEVDVTFLIKGREWKNPQGEVKYFNSLDVFRITKLGEAKFKNETLTPIITPDDSLPF